MTASPGGYPVNLLPKHRCQARDNPKICRVLCTACLLPGIANVQNSVKSAEPLILGSYNAITRTFE